MGIKSEVREMVIRAVQYAVREEMKNYNMSSTQQLEARIEALERQLENETWCLEKNLDKSIERWTWERYQRTERKIDEKVRYWTGQRETEIDKRIEKWTWDRYKRAEDKLLYIYKIQNELAQILYLQNKVPYCENEKIRIVFLFQVASFWPSWESFYYSCIRDERIDVKFLFLDENGRESVQMNSAEEFISNSGIDFIRFEDFDVDEYKPHVIVMQTPYDAGHRIKAHWSAAWKSKGYRIVYIPYGIEISDTEASHGMHFEQHVVENAWRVYTFNEMMIRDYRKFCINAHAVRAVGLPKFDSLFNKEQLQMPEYIIDKAGGRPICLWKVHFPKIFEMDGKDVFASPDLNEYMKFTDYIASRQDLFFIFMPHPRFREPVKNIELQNLAVQLFNVMENLPNVHIDESDDYRVSLANADYIIIDRSAVMVEAAATGVPILYMYNADYNEPLTKGVKPIINSYYQGTTCEDMIYFLEKCINEGDDRKRERANSFSLVYPYFDGKAGERIKNDIIESLEEELSF